MAKQKKPLFELGQIYDPSFENLNKSETEQNIDAMACKVEEGEYTKILTQDELAVTKSEFAEKSLRVSKLETEKKTVVDDYNEQLKIPKKEAKELLEQIKTKTVRKEGKLYLVDDQENAIMYKFDENAICVDSRALLPLERQTTIQGVRSLQAGT
ncbi:MAG: hypothetical protein QM499_01090 [Flavobacteriaceae bacterium]